MSDTISRQDAIDAIVAWTVEDRPDVEMPTDLIDRITGLSSAQPERPEQPESAKEYCAECDHIEMCRWYPYEGCNFEVCHPHN